MGKLAGVVIIEVGRNTVLISFSDHEKGRQILLRGPWSFRGHLINLSLWTGLQPIDSINHNIMELWMQMYGVPLSYMSTYTTEAIGRAFGTVVEIEDPVVNNLFHRSFLRAKLFMDISRPLPTSIWFPDVTSQRPVAVSAWDPLKPRYLPGLGLSRPPPIQEMEDLETRIQVDSWENEIL
ncbi:hypothetical protein PIB30_046729 [Stylosanthes scabra]|uniref:DUF4283 domain-containing protein n=1 Tax=Stylosanthes scabra TaxID=79078 RepID=A0ABU6QG00_9FABA|nr:hypothetical protein [Stylosanthes scabra]